MNALGLSVVIFIIAFFLGPQFEESLSQTLALINGDAWALLNYPIAVALVALSGVTLAMITRKVKR